MYIENLKLTVQAVHMQITIYIIYIMIEGLYYVIKRISKVSSLALEHYIPYSRKFSRVAIFADVGF